MGGVGLFFAMASLGLPGLGNFVAEFLVLVGAYRVSVPMTVLATLGLVAATVYSLRIVQRTFHGENLGGWAPADLTTREMAAFGAMILALVWLGFYPRPVLNTAEPALKSLQVIAAPAARVAWKEHP
jgi:NADH-quinone oxidoreductase subunit M